MSGTAKKLFKHVHHVNAILLALCPLLVALSNDTSATMISGTPSTFAPRHSSVTSKPLSFAQILFAPPEIGQMQSTDNPGNGITYETACQLTEADAACSRGGSRFLASPSDTLGIPDASVTIECSYLCCSPSEITWTLNSKPLPFAAQVQKSVVRITDPITQSTVRARRVELVFKLTSTNERAGYYQCHINNTAIGAVVASSAKALVRLTDSVAVIITLRITSHTFQAQLLDATSSEYSFLQDMLLQEMWTFDGIKKTSDKLIVMSFSNGSVVASVLLLRSVNSGDSICLQTLTSIVIGATNMTYDPNYSILQLDCCLRESVNIPGNRGLVTWPPTERASLVSVECPFADYGAGLTATRSCQGDSSIGVAWGVANTSSCQPQSIVTVQLEILTQTPVTVDNAAETTLRVANLTANTSTINVKNDLVFISDLLQDITRAVVNDTQVQSQVSSDIVKEIDNLLNLDESKLIESGNAFNTSNVLLETLVEAAAHAGNASDTKEVNTLQNFVVVTPKSDSGASISGVRVVVSGSASNVAITDETTTTNRADEAQVNLDLIIPASVISTAANQSKDNSSSGPAQPIIIIFKKASLFLRSEPNASLSLGQINTHIVKAYFPGQSLQGLDPPLRMLYQPTLAADLNSAQCVFWNVSLNGFRGNWSTSGCQYKGVFNGLVACECDHMTSFSVLMDLLPDTITPPPLALSIVTYVGCGLSILGLSLTLVTYICFSKLRRGARTSGRSRSSRNSKILLCFCATMLVTLVVFIVGIKDSYGRVACRVNAVVLHYFILSTFMWTLAEGVHLYLCFVRIMGRYIPRFMTKAALGAWGLPAVIVAATAAVRYEHDYGSDRFCVVRGVSFYAAWLAPICLVLVVNFFIFILVLRAVRASSSIEKDKQLDGLAKARIFATCTALLGLTWLLGLLAVGDLRLPLQYAFAIVNSLQGFAIFVFYCLLNADARKAWLRRCCRKRSAYRAGTRSTSSGRDSKSRNATRKSELPPQRSRATYDNVPIAPFWTSQSEEEGNSHGAVSSFVDTQHGINPAPLPSPTAHAVQTVVSRPPRAIPLRRAQSKEQWVAEVVPFSRQNQSFLEN